jgi:hypothetical protein
VAEIEWNAKELQAFARSLNADRDGRALKKQMQSQFDSITEDLRDKLREGVRGLPGLGSYPSVAAESMKFTTKLIGGKNARVSIVGEGKTARGKWREFGSLLDRGFLFHPAWGRWLGKPPPASLRMGVPAGPQMVTNVLEDGTKPMQEQIREVLNDYLERLTDIRKAKA